KSVRSNTGASTASGCCTFTRATLPGCSILSHTSCMALSSSFQLPLGTEAPAFELADVTTGDLHASSDATGRPLLVLFLCTHCPYVKLVEEELARIGREYGDRVAIYGIASNDPERSPADAPDGLREQAERVGFPFPYLFDESQDVARAYGAVCTPDIFLFDAGHRLAYRGRLDASRPRKDIP